MERDEIDFGTLKVSVLFRKLFIPTLFGMLSISAVTVADGIFVGHGVGSDGIAAVNIYVPLLMLFQGVGLMIGIGCSVVASIHLSRAKVKAARLNVTQAMIVVTALTLLLSLLIVVFPDRTACLLGSSDRLLPLVKDYLLWFTPALVFQMWTAVGLFVIRLDGAPKLAMWCSVVAALLNVVLDWLFIFPLGWGVMGAAFATAISVSVGGVIVVVYLSFFARTLRFCPLKRSRKSLRLSLRNVGYQCRIGSSALLGEATLAMLMFVGNLTFIHYLGDDGVGAFGIACYYIPFVFMVGNAIAQSAQPIISYNFGAGVRERVIEAAQIALATAVVCGAAVTAVFIGSPRLLVGLFLDPATHAARIAIEGLPWFALGFICFIVNLTAIGYYQSLERVGIASGFALLRGFVFLVPSFLFMPRLCGTEGIWLAMPLSELLTALVILGVSGSADRLRPIANETGCCRRQHPVSFVPAASDRHDLPLLAVECGVERFGELLQQFLYLRFAVFRLVFGHSLLLRLLEGFDRVAAGVAQTHTGRLGLLPDLFHEQFAALLGQRRDRQENLLAVVRGGKADIGIDDRLFDRFDHLLVPRLDQDRLRIGYGDARDARYGGHRAVVVHHDAVQNVRRRLAGADVVQLLFEMVDSTLHAAFDVGHNRLCICHILVVC